MDTIALKIMAVLVRTKQSLRKYLLISLFMTAYLPLIYMVNYATLFVAANWFDYSNPDNVVPRSIPYMSIITVLMLLSVLIGIFILVRMISAVRYAFGIELIRAAVVVIGLGIIEAVVISFLPD